MTCGKGWDIRPDTKSEAIVRWRDAGMSYGEIAARLQISVNSARVLHWKRNNMTRRRSVDDPPLPVAPTLPHALPAAWKDRTHGE